MPWIVITANGDELDRRELSSPVVIGRSPECDVAVRDILLSRAHCRIEPTGRGGWQVVDLGSKNGTRVGWQQVKSHVLRDGDHLRMGRTRIVYHLGPFEPAPAKKPPRTDRLVRPADPHEALTGTVTDFVLLDDEVPQVDPQVDIPRPQPRPLDPASYTEPAVESLLDELASSTWTHQTEPTSHPDLAQAHANGPAAIVRALPRLPRPVYRQVRQLEPVDISLQVDASMLTPLPVSKPVQSRRRRYLTTAGITLAAVAGTAIVLMSLWLLTLAP